ncbi:phosphotransferase [Brachybacterium hainanense]|uniref:Phosphotransferase n=1 Tax=Brachybacterium hainanense TaxID=1541174 RepID=A0ABV6R6Z3_9MICO
MGRGWAPDATWEMIGADEGAATLGVWRARRHDRDWVVKRLQPDPEHRDPSSFRWWRREVALVESGIGTEFTGLVAPDSFVEEDEEGATIWAEYIRPTPIPPAITARALGTFAAVDLEDPGWFVRGRLRDRVRMAARHDPVRLQVDGVPARVVADAEEVWRLRESILDRLDAMPHVLSHGDAIPRNLLRHDGPTVTAIDWDQLGCAPVGADLASFAAWVDADEDLLLASYLDGAGSLDLDAGVLRDSIALTSALIAVSRVIRAGKGAQMLSPRERLLGAERHLGRALAARR